MQPNDRISPQAGKVYSRMRTLRVFLFSSKGGLTDPSFSKRGMFFVERAAKSLENFPAARFEFVTHQCVALVRIVAAGDEMSFGQTKAAIERTRVCA
ncbi:hypothetical protein [Sinorhizobium meliloti]|uniref:hypothetical protein n=1 Tax=Rhizobium meliloti TaxID=382 RepID=UPI0018659E46|nr:hypothetical protein [Sinorhizobium meliloti]